MKIYVDMDKCQHYGQCTFEAPTVFALNDATAVKEPFPAPVGRWVGR